MTLIDTRTNFKTCVICVQFIVSLCWHIIISGLNFRQFSEYQFHKYLKKKKKERPKYYQIFRLSKHHEDKSQKALFKIYRACCSCYHFRNAFSKTIMLYQVFLDITKLLILILGVLQKYENALQCFSLRITVLTTLCDLGVTI